MTLEEIGAQQPEVSRRPEALGGDAATSRPAPAQTTARQSGPDRSPPEREASAEAATGADGSTDPAPPTLTKLDVVDPPEAAREPADPPARDSGEPSSRESTR
jgi:hypothetical protein